jgi:hypothetical protein
VVDKAALGQVFFKYFCFPCQPWTDRSTLIIHHLDVDSPLETKKAPKFELTAYARANLPVFHELSVNILPAK